MCNNDIVIKVENLSKKFCRNLRRSMLYGTMDVIKNMLGIPDSRKNLRKDEFWALENINFELKRGETFGIIGANGSGKSTLLRIITGVYPPDVGKVSIKGRVSALIAVGAGFHPHMTGRENIYLNGTILGMTKEEIKKNFNSIIEFAEVGDFIDAPVSTYSSGMFVRLGFSIAVHSNPEILIADEVLSVGDYMFQMKCFKKISELLMQGCSVILISHSEIAIRSVCKQVIILHKSRVIDIGKTDDMILKYRSLMINERFEKENKQVGSESSPFINKVGFSTDGKVKIKNIDLFDKNNILIRHNHQELQKIKYSRKNSILIILEIEVLEALVKPRISFYIRDMSKSDLTYVCASVFSRINVEKLERLKKGVIKVSCKLDISNLTPNVYNIIAGVGNEQFHIQLHDCIDETDKITFEIINSEELIESDALLNKPYYLPDNNFEIRELN